MKQLIVLFMFILLLLPACNKKKSNIITFDLKRKDYIETINATGTVQAVNNVVILAPRVNAGVLTVTHLAEAGSSVKKGDTICILESADLLSSLESLTTDLHSWEGNLKKLEADNAMQLALLNAQVETNKAQIAISMMDTLKLKFAPPAEKKLLNLEMEKAVIEQNKLQKKFSAQKRINSSEVIKLTSRIMMQKSRIQLYLDQIKSMKLIAPCDGIVMHTESPSLYIMSSFGGSGTIGGKIEERSSVISNMPILQIPSMNEMQVLAEVPERDYKLVQNGQKVLITVEAASNLKTTGKIKRKSLQRPNNPVSTAVKTYEVIISVDSCHSKMNPGLSALCRIIIDEVKDTIMVPAAAIFEKDTSKIVYIFKGKKFVPVLVETGTSNGSVTIISKGLAGNETIALNQPPHNMIIEDVKINKDKANSTGPDKRDTIPRKVISKGSSLK
jgi:HlyD family secretion protein